MRSPAALLLGVVGILCTAALPNAGELSAQWVVPQGSGWVDLAVYRQDTETRYDFAGERERFFADGRAISVSTFITAAAGVVRGVDVWTQLALHDLRYNDEAGRRRSTGPGDLKLFVRAGPEALGLNTFPVALRAGIKLPAGDFDVDAEIIPLGEGQVDVELMIELGRSLHPRSLWTSGWVGHRSRFQNTETLRTPGNEWFWFWNGGGRVGATGWTVALEGIHGDDWMIEGLRISSARRRLVQGFITLDHPLGPGHVKLGARRTLGGRNFPAGAALSLGYFVRWG